MAEETEKYWTVQQLCERFGCNRLTLLRWEKSGKVEFKRIGRRVYIDPLQFEKQKSFRIGNRFFVDMTK